jgi:hypothetical protein
MFLTWEPTPKWSDPQFEQIDAFDSRCNHESPSDKSVGCEQIGRLNQSRDKEHNLHLPEEVYQMGSGFPRYICASAHSSRRLLTCHLKTGSCSLSVFKLINGREKKDFLSF